MPFSFENGVVWTGSESQPCRRCSQNRRKTQTESGDRPEEKRLTSVPTEFIAIFLNADIRLESI